MKPIQRKDLVIGEVYADTTHKEDITHLQLIEKDEEENELRFKYVSGSQSYIENEEGLIIFIYNDNDPFYIQEDNL